MLSTDQNINTISEALERLKKKRSQTNSAVACQAGKMSRATAFVLAAQDVAARELVRSPAILIKWHQKPLVN